MVVMKMESVNLRYCCQTSYLSKNNFNVFMMISGNHGNSEIVSDYFTWVKKNTWMCWEPVTG